MTRVKCKSMVAVTLMTALFSTLAAGCYYYERDDYERRAERRYSYRYDRDRDYSRYRDRDVRYGQHYDRDSRYSRNDRFDSVHQYD